MVDQKKQPKKLITYIGADTVFYENLKLFIAEKHSNLGVELKKIFSVDEKEIQSYINLFREERPQVILVDLSQAGKSFLHLARVWQRQNFYKKIHMIGLLDYGQSREELTQALSASLRAVHIKSSELDSIVYNIIAFGFEDKFENHGFATAELSDELMKAYFLCKPTVVTEEFLELESDFNLLPGQEVKIKSHWTEKAIVRSQFCRLETQSMERTYYNLKYSQKFKFMHMDPVDLEGLSRDEAKLKIKRRNELVQESQYRLSKWVADNYYNSSPKHFRVFVIDKEGVFYQDSRPTDQNSFVFRCQPFLNTPEMELKVAYPHMIIYHLEDVDEEELEANADIAHTYNETRTLQILLKSLKKIYPAKERPYVVVFNSKEYETEYLQKTLDYKNIVAYGDSLSVDLATKLIKMLEKKMEPSFPPPTKSRIVFNKNMEESFAEIESEISVVACSEADIYFDVDFDIDLHTVIKIYKPFPMFVTIITPPEGSKVTSKYYGIIHGIGEEEKQALRRYVNSIFFRELDLERAKDAEEIEKLKQEFMQKRKEEAEAAKKKTEAEAGLKRKEEEERAKAKAEAQRDSNAT